MLTLIKKRSALGSRTEWEEVPLRSGATLWDYVPEPYCSIPTTFVFNGEIVDEDHLRAVIPMNGNRLSMAPKMGIIGTLILTAVQIGLAVGAWAIGRHQKQTNKHALRHAKIGDNYAFDIMGNTSEEGAPIPVLYGTQRIGGQYLSLFTRQHEEGVDRFHMLLGLSEGPINAINPNGAVDLHLDGNSSANYRGITTTSKTGTNTDTSIPDFDTTVTTTPMNAQLLHGQANKVACAGTTAADKAYIKIQFVSGMYKLDNDGHPHSVRFKCESRGQKDGGGWGAWSNYTAAPFELISGSTLEEVLSGHYAFRRRRTTAFSIWLEFVHASNGTWDIDLSKTSSNTDSTRDIYVDPYVKEYQEVAYDDLRYPNLAKVGITGLAQDQLAGDTPRATVLAQGRIIMSLTSATAVAAPALSNNPADVFLDILYNRRYGLGNEVDTRINITVSNIGGGPFTTNEVVTGPASNYQFKGIWRALDGTTATIECTQGVPYTSLTGADSGATCDIDSLDEAFATDLDKLWEFSQFCDEQVPDGSTTTTVDANSASGQKVLNVTATTMFTAGDVVVINYQGDREESKTIDTIQAGVSITMTANLDYAHTAAQEDVVSVAENRCEFDFLLGGTESGWDFLDRICFCSQAFLAKYAGKVWPRKLASETPNQLVCEGNQRASGLTVTYRSLDYPNVFEGYYRDKAHDYRLKIVSIEAPELYTNDEKVRRLQLDLNGIARASQASRICRLKGKRERYTGKHIKFAMGQDFVDFEPGDVFRYQHGMPGIGTGGGRIFSSTALTATLDHDVTVSGGETIRVEHQDGTQETKTLDATAGTIRLITITAPWGTNPTRDTKYIIGTPGQYRCISRKPHQDQLAEITAEEDAAAYYDDDFGTIPTFTESTLRDPHAMPADVTGVVLTGGAAINQDQSITYLIQCDFIPPKDENWHHAEVWLKEISGQLAEISATNYEPGTGNGEFNRPRGVCSDGTYIYVCDTLNNRIQKLNAQDLSHDSNIGSSGTGNGQFTLPMDVDTDGTHIWVADTWNNRVQKLTVAGVYVDKLGTAGAGADQFSKPFGICHDSNASEIFVCDTYNHRIVLIDDALDGNGGAGTWTTLGAQGAGNDQFERPMGVDHNHANSFIYVADTGNDRVVKIDDAIVGAGGGTWATIGTTGTGNDNFKFPTDVACDAAGDYIYVCDMYNHRYHLREDDLTYVATMGSEGRLRDQFKNPAGIALLTDSLYICEQENHRVQLRDYLEGSAAGYEKVGETDVSGYRIREGLAGGETYRVSIVSVGENTNKKDPRDGVTDTVTVGDRTQVPPNPVTFTATNAGAQLVRLTWSGGTCFDFEGYEIRVGNAWASATFVAITKQNTITIGAPVAGQSRTYYVAGKTTSEVYSATPASVTYTAPHISAALPRNIGQNYAV
jgi:hypothetical protein